MNKNIQQLRKYFQAFADKNIEVLTEMFTDDIILIDWNNTFTGKDQVVNEVQGIFANFKTIKLEVTDIFSSLNIINADRGETTVSIPKDDSFACEIVIVFDDLEPLYIMDLIEFDNEGRIKKLTAYNRNFGK
tara:strand:- start:1056 stop:1451 length:396 start_codon:yes stop_codon:yes gene_type:complete